MVNLRFIGESISPLLTRTELDQMPDTPTRRSQHRRAHSETFLRFPDLDDLLLDVEPDLNLDLPPTPTTLFPSGTPPAGLITGQDAEFVDAFGYDSQPGEVKQGPRHRHSNSMDGYNSVMLFEGDSLGKKMMAADRLAELSLIDPKKAKRILANRQSAARSKERKLRYTEELERKVQALQGEATKLTAQITSLQRDTNGLTTENKELKLKLQALEQQAHLRDALNEALRNEVQRLKITAGHLPYINVSSSMASSHYFDNHQHQQPLLSPRHDSRRM